MSARLNLAERGSPSAPALLLLHGFMGSGSDWDLVAERLAERFRCITPDLPGHGASLGLGGGFYTFAGAVAALAELLDQLGIESCAVAGYSLGGRLSLAFALAHPGRCSRLVLESASPGLEGAGERAARLELDHSRATEIEDDFDAFIDQWYQQPLWASLAADEALLQRTIAARHRGEPSELARALRGFSVARQPSFWPDVGTLRMPALVVAGELDSKYAEIAARMADLNDGVRTAIIPGAGHNTHAEQPEQFIALLRDFLNHQ